MKSATSFLVCAWLLGCGSSSEPKSCPEGAKGTAGGEQAAAPNRDAMVGTWAEYWSVAGKAATSQYEFAADGTWSWRAVPDTEAVVAKTGSWEMSDGALTLTTTAQDQRPGCPEACEPGVPKHVELSPAVVEKLPIGTCPPNDEARKMDASYTCMSLGDRAYWRR